MTLFKSLLICLCCLLLSNKVYCQANGDVLNLDAYRMGFWVDPKTGKLHDFVLCGESVKADTMGFFTIMSGCERDVWLLIGKYSFEKDTLRVAPFDFILEKPFLHIYKRRSTSFVQTIKFVSNNLQALNGMDSSWMVCCFKRRKQNLLDFSSSGIVKLARSKYEGIELLQLTKIFGNPIVLFLDNRYDYRIVVNMPLEPLVQKLQDVYAIQGKYFIKSDSLYAVGDNRGYKIVEAPTIR